MNKSYLISTSKCYSHIHRCRFNVRQPLYLEPLCIIGVIMQHSKFWASGVSSASFKVINMPSSVWVRIMRFIPGLSRSCCRRSQLIWSSAIRGFSCKVSFSMALISWSTLKIWLQPCGSTYCLFWWEYTVLRSELSGAWYIKFPNLNIIHTIIFKCFYFLLSWFFTLLCGPCGLCVCSSNYVFLLFYIRYKYMFYNMSFNHW